jgi:predicted MarR family transcription regulator
MATKRRTQRKTSESGPIVSSAHLAAGAMPALSELEFGLILLGHAFDRWMVRCMAAAGVPDLSPLDVLVIHTIAHRDKPKRLADICLVLSIEETHLVTYSVKKLDGHGLIASGRSGNEKVVSLTRKGEQMIHAYTRLRERLLVAPVKSSGSDPQRLSEDVGPLRPGGARRGEFMRQRSACASERPVRSHEPTTRASPACAGRSPRPPPLRRRTGWSRGRAARR